MALKDIRIFIASSRELVRERNALAFLVLAKEEESAARGFRVRLAKWEYVDPKMTGERTEDWLNREISPPRTVSISCMKKPPEATSKRY